MNQVKKFIKSTLQDISHLVNKVKGSFWYNNTTNLEDNFRFFEFLKKYRLDKLDNATEISKIVVHEFYHSYANLFCTPELQSQLVSILNKNGTKHITSNFIGIDGDELT